MYTQAVDVLHQVVCDNPLPGCAQQSIPSPLNVLVDVCIEMSSDQDYQNPADDDSSVPLPIPASGFYGRYSQPEAAKILGATKKGTSMRSQTMQEMMKRGYAPASKSYLSKLVKLYSDGKVIPDIEWDSQTCQSETCRGIQSLNLDTHAPFHP